MRSYANWILIALLMCILVSFGDKDKPTKGLNLGDSAPNFEIRTLSNKDSNINLTDLQGQYVLLSFWASYDAQSRMNNVSLSNMLRLNNSNVKMVSISFDNYLSIFKETIKKDQIVTSNCFVDLNGEQSKLYNQYNLSQGFTNYLINNKGIIVAKNLSTKDLSEYIK